jgi:hypothetical protein
MVQLSDRRETMVPNLLWLQPALLLSGHNRETRHFLLATAQGVKLVQDAQTTAEEILDEDLLYELADPPNARLIAYVRAAERARCTAWAKLYWDGDLSDDHEMYVGIRDGKLPPDQPT